MNTQDLLWLLNYLVNHYDVVVVTAIVGYLFKVARVYGPQAEAWLQVKLGEKNYRLAQDLAITVVTAVEQIANSPDVRAKGDVKFAMANKRLDAMLQTKGINYSAETLETLIEEAVRTQKQPYGTLAPAKTPAGKDPGPQPVPFPNPQPVPVPPADGVTPGGAIGSGA